MRFAIVVPWHNQKQLREFLTAWNINVPDVQPPWLFLQQDTTKAGCAQTKNAGIQRAYDAGAETIIVLDDDCYPPTGRANIMQGSQVVATGAGPVPGYKLEDLAEDHIKALSPQKVTMVYACTNPPSRGTPYRHRQIDMPVAASMGFWTRNPDFDAVASLIYGADGEISYAQQSFFGRYFPFSGMNFAFNREWIDCAVLIDVPRFDDIWMGWIWEKVAYEKGYCFNLNGPMITHARQSNVWQNLRDEARYLEINEDLWSVAHTSPAGLTATQIRERLFGFLQAPASDPTPASAPAASA